MKRTTPQKRRGPETWNLVKEAYIAGHPAPALAITYDVTEAAIRQRAYKGGWTRKQLAEAAEARAPRTRGLSPTPGSDPDLTSASANGMTPQAALASAIAQASALLGAGRSAEAGNLLKAAELLGRLAGVTPTCESEHDRPPSPPMREPTMLEVFEIAQRLADLMLIDDPDADLDRVTAPFVYRWRAEVLGPELARWDWERAVGYGTAEGVWDEEGRLMPITDAPPPADLDLLARQALHWRNIQGADAWEPPEKPAAEEQSWRVGERLAAEPSEVEPVEWRPRAL